MIAQLKRSGERVTALEARLPGLQTCMESVATQDVHFTIAKVTGSTVVVADLKWKYDWEEIRFTEATASVATKTNGLRVNEAGKSYNLNELNNTATLWAPLGLPSNVPIGFKLKPIAIGTPIMVFPVRDTTGKVWWMFDKVNAIDGECP